MRCLNDYRHPFNDLRTSLNIIRVQMSEAVVLGLEGNENANKWFTERQCDLFNTVLPLFEVRINHACNQ